MNQTATCRERIGSIMRDRLEKLAVLSNDVRTEVQSRLESIMADNEGKLCVGKDIECRASQDPYPQYFSFMRDRVNNIESDLTAIKDMISRTEI